MDKEFVIYKIALELKRLGFDEPCFGRIYADGSIELLSYLYKNSDQIGEGTTCSSPLKQQVFRWFREKYGIYGSPEKFDEKTWWVKWGYWDSSICETYEEAENEWLLKLIETVKESLD